MDNRTPILVLPNGSSSYNADINASIKLMPDGLNIKFRGGGGGGEIVSSRRMRKVVCTCSNLSRMQQT